MAAASKMVVRMMMMRTMMMEAAAVVDRSRRRTTVAKWTSAGLWTRPPAGAECQGEGQEAQGLSAQL